MRITGHQRRPLLGMAPLALMAILFLPGSKAPAQQFPAPAQQFPIDLGRSYLLDLQVKTGKSTKPGPGYVQVGGDLNAGAGGEFIYLHAKYGYAKSPKEIINGIRILFGKNARAPKGYKKIPVDLNQGAGGKYIYLAYTRDAPKPYPVVKVRVTTHRNRTEALKVPPGKGWTRSTCDLNAETKKKGDPYIFLSYRQVGFPERFARELVVSGHPDRDFNGSFRPSQGSKGRIYYDGYPIYVRSVKSGKSSRRLLLVRYHSNTWVLGDGAHLQNKPWPKSVARGAGGTPWDAEWSPQGLNVRPVFGTSARKWLPDTPRLIGTGSTQNAFLISRDSMNGYPIYVRKGLIEKTLYLYLHSNSMPRQWAVQETRPTPRNKRPKARGFGDTPWGARWTPKTLRFGFAD